MAEKILLREIDGPVATLTLNRPEKRNALTRELIHALTQALVELDERPAVRVIVLTGAGQSFCSGMDLDEVQAHCNEKDAREDADALSQLFVQMQWQRQPIVAALNGSAVAGGAGLMTACDLVVAVESAKIGYPEVLRGIIAAIVAPLLVRQVGERRARKLLLSGAVIPAKEAERIGLINDVVPAGGLAEYLEGLKHMLLTAGPEAVCGTKRQLARTLTNDAASGQAAEISAQARLSEEASEGLAAYLEKRDPAWSRVRP